MKIKTENHYSIGHLQEGSFGYLEWALERFIDSNIASIFYLFYLNFFIGWNQTGIINWMK
jgi:hypothetical protein